MIELYGFGPAFGLIDASPFVIKADLILKMSKLDYQLKRGSLQQAPKGKLPYIRVGQQLIGDSTLIRWFIEQQYQLDLDAGLSPQQRGIAWAFEKMLDEHLYYALSFERWLIDDNFNRSVAQFFRQIPALLRLVIVPLVRRKVAKSLTAQGIGRHSHADIVRLAQRDLLAVSQQLGEQPYLTGERICSADASVFALLASLLCSEYESALRNFIMQQPNLVAYHQRLQQEFYSPTA